MPLLTRLRRSARAGKNAVAGAAVAVHAGDGGTDEARALAASLPVDPDHQVVVADLPAESPIEAWESFAAGLPKDRRPVRLVPGRPPLEISPSIPPWLAERLGRPVLAPYGRVHRGAAGALFVHSGPRTGWGWFRPKQPAAWTAKRFPLPAWESPALAEVVAAGTGAVAEPLPAGMWIHPAGADEKFARERLGLVGTLPCQPGTPVIVLGSAEVPGLDPGDVAAFWRTLPAEVRDSAWFVLLGGLKVPEGGAAGPALAAAIGTEALCYNGIPVGSPDAPEVVALRQDGGQGWRTFARGFAYRPGETRPRLRGHRVPVGDLPEIVPGVYRYTPDVVVEIVQSGLWVRSLDSDGVGTGDTARSVPVDPACALVLYEAADPATADRLRAAAEGLIKGLDPTVAPTARVRPVGAPGVDAPVERTTRLSTVAPPEDDQAERTTRLMTTPTPPPAARRADEPVERTTRLPVAAPPPGEATAALSAGARPGEQPGRLTTRTTAGAAPAARPEEKAEALTTRMAVRAVPAAAPPEDRTEGKPEDKAEVLTTRMAVRAVPTPPAPPEDRTAEKTEAVAETGSADTALPFLSRMMETVVMPVPASLRASAPEPAPRPSSSRLSARLEGHTDDRSR
ncbi:hypothetical protein [Amycolatopsis samaneae]|uniref:Uncharacterized protein n=1 Tax=Amycolatopsis samaneae TaxID=664691 RepID=A0ABW5GLF0_9PSEU